MITMVYQITDATIVYSTVYSGTDQRKHQRFASQVFVRGVHQWRLNSPQKGSVTRKMFPFYDVIMNIYPIGNYDMDLHILGIACYSFVIINTGLSKLQTMQWSTMRITLNAVISYLDPCWFSMGKDSGPRLNIKTVLSTYGDFHVKDKTAVRTSYL